MCQEFVNALAIQYYTEINLCTRKNVYVGNQEDYSEHEFRIIATKYDRCLDEDTYTAL